VRSSNEQIEAALTWILEKIDLQIKEVYTRADDIDDPVDLTGLPFVPSRPEMLLTGAALFLAAIFGRESDPDVLAIYRWLSAQGIKNMEYVSDNSHPKE
jgi:hypothetical protein